MPGPPTQDSGIRRPLGHSSDLRRQRTERWAIGAGRKRQMDPLRLPENRNKHDTHRHHRSQGTIAHLFCRFPGGSRSHPINIYFRSARKKEKQRGGGATWFYVSPLRPHASTRRAARRAQAAASERAKLVQFHKCESGKVGM